MLLLLGSSRLSVPNVCVDCSMLKGSSSDAKWRASALNSSMELNSCVGPAPKVVSANESCTENLMWGTPESIDREWQCEHDQSRLPTSSSDSSMGTICNETSVASDRGADNTERGLVLSGFAEAAAARIDSGMGSAPRPRRATARMCSGVGLCDLGFFWVICLLEGPADLAVFPNVVAPALEKPVDPNWLNSGPLTLLQKEEKRFCTFDSSIRTSASNGLSSSAIRPRGSVRKEASVPWNGISSTDPRSK
mmetsp:Transcript_45894/g.98363  ORF Transcript_45894/g.98363 Transcript_45894/m.98363 type:complete len:250 (-) Transcript_45894:24-773(-)